LTSRVRIEFSCESDIPTSIAGKIMIIKKYGRNMYDAMPIIKVRHAERLERKKRPPKSEKPFGDFHPQMAVALFYIN